MATEAGRTVVQHARQHDADNARAVRHGGQAKERIDSRPVTVLACPLGDQHLVLLDEEMAVRRRDIDASRLKAASVFGQLRLKRLVAIQPPERRFSGIVSGHVLDDEVDAGTSVGNWPTRTSSASSPPADVPRTTMFRPLKAIPCSLPFSQ